MGSDGTSHVIDNAGGTSADAVTAPVGTAGAQGSSVVSSQDVTTSSNLREAWSGVGIDQFWASLNSSKVVPARACLEGVAMVTPVSSDILHSGVGSDLHGGI